MSEHRPDEPTPNQGASATPFAGEPFGDPDPQASLGLLLRGALPCIGCGYDLQGLSVVGKCPECGSTVRATILSRVDPQAEELVPVRTPIATGVGLPLGVGVAVIAAAMSWWPRAVDLVGRFVLTDLTPLAPEPLIGFLLAALVLVAGGASLTLLRPFVGMPRRETMLVATAAPLFAPLAWAMWRIHAVIDAGMAPPYFVASPNHERIALRLLIAGCLVLILLALRPTARRVARRSLALRSTRADRQTVLAMVAAIGVTAVGDGLRLFSTTLTSPADIVNNAGSLLVFVGSLLFTIGAVGAFIDALRVGRDLHMPSPSLRQVVTPASSAPAPNPSRS